MRRTPVFLLLGALIAISLMTAGCATKKAVEHTQQSQITSIVRDTVRDSVYINNNVYRHDSVIIYTKGDTVFKDRWKILTEYQDRWRDRWRTEIVHDTIVRIDSLTVTKEKQLTRWQSIQIWGGRVFFVIMLGIAAIIALKMTKVI